MKKIYLLGLSLVVAGLVGGCGSSSDGDGEDNPLSVQTKTITTVEEAKQAAGAFTQFNSMSNFGSSFANNSVYAPNRAPSLASIPSQQQACYNGGTMTTSGDYSSDGTEMDLTQSYDNCDMSGIVMDGSTRIKMEQNGNDLNMIMTMNNFQYTQGSNYYKMDFTMDIDTNTQYNPMTMDLDGSISLSASGYTYEANYNHFRIRTENNYMNISGTVSMESDIYSCYNGTYTIETTSDLYSNGYGYSSGEMIVNGARYTYSGNDVQITLANGDTSTVSQSSLGTCD